MAFLGQEAQLRELQDRFKFLYAAMFVLLGIVGARMLYLQILSGDEMRKFSEENRIKRVRIAAPRGMIFDRSRTLLIDNRPAFDLEITPQYLNESGDRAAVLRQLSRLIDTPPEKIQERLDKGANQPRFLPVKIKTDLSRDEVAKIETWKIDMPGVAVETEILRTNVYADTATHLLGYIGSVTQLELPTLNSRGRSYSLGDYVGKAGIERELEAILRGRDGMEIVEVDALGRRIREQARGRVLADASAGRSAVPGKNLVLTIDQDLQLTAKEAFGDKSGSLVAIDPKTGEILAMISRPAFDSTAFSRGVSPGLWAELLNNPNRPLRDKTIQDHYMPGSVFKVITAITGLEEGVIDEKSTFNCPGVIRVGRRPYHCHRRGGHGTVNVVEALMYSCDVFFYRLAQKIQSVDNIADWARRMGLGARTNIRLSREVPGLIPTEQWKMDRLKKVWTAGETLSVAIGQSYVLATTLQLAQLYATLANGGTLYRPHFVRAIESPDGQVLEEFGADVVKKITLNPKTIQLVDEGLYRVVNDPRGTAFHQRIPGVDFVGKTGTSQVIRLSADRIYQKCDEMQYKYRHHGVFAGFAPKKDPSIVVAVVAEHACSGSGGAAPIARAVIAKYLEKYHPEMMRAGALALPKLRPAPPAVEEEAPPMPEGTEIEALPLIEDEPVQIPAED
ncbi:MAG: penicillin-binding protein 2 [Bdellovibrionales bacterium]|nr:penicillin-binding protein 2 [Bdellovibrionales bacterium]